MIEDRQLLIESAKQLWEDLDKALPSLKILLINLGLDINTYNNSTQILDLMLL